MSQSNVYQFSWNYILLKLLTLTSSIVTESLGQLPKHWQQHQYQHQQYEYLHDSTSGPVSSTAPGTRHSQISLSPTVRTQHVFAMFTNDTTFGFDISKEQRAPDVTSDYKLNVIVETLSWSKWYRSERRPLPCIVVQGVTGGHENKSVKFCYEIHNDLNNFQTVREAMDDLNLVTISAEGDWTDTQAKLVASIYYEVPDGCGNCAPGYFCCGIEGSTCSTNQRSISWGDEVMYRCIPISGQYGDRNTDTICNSHPNCGFICNFDESPGQCSGGTPGDICFGGDCNLANVALRIAVLVIFCFLLPPVIILFLCRFNAVRGWCQRVSGRLLNRGHRDSDVTIGEAAEPSVATISRSRRERRSTHSYNPDDDPPPSYEDYLRHFKETDTPLYNEVFPASASPATANPCDVVEGINFYTDMRRPSQRSDVGVNISPNEIDSGREGVANLGFIGEEGVGVGSSS